MSGESMEILVKFVIGLAGSAAIAGVAYRKRSLSKSGAVAAVLLGTALYAAGSVAWFGTLIVFFVSSTLLSRIRHRKKQEAEQHYEKGGRRDAGQVLANGGLPLIAVLAYAFTAHEGWWLLFLGSLAAVNADTWATELGALSRRHPRSLLSGKPVPAGTSGGVTPLGLAASGAGGCVIGLAAFVLSLAGGSLPDGSELSIVSLLQIILVSGIAGLLGSLLDSLLGATLQANYRCVVCGRLVERPRHCNEQAEHIRGFKWMRNDQVNLSAALFGGVSAVILHMF